MADDRDAKGRFVDEHTPLGNAVSTFTPELGARICDAISDGNSLRRVCAMEGMPCKRTVLSWVSSNPDFAKMYRVAQQERAEGWIEEIVDIADDTSGDYTLDIDSGAVRIDTEHINRSRLRVDTRKWIAAKAMPKLYGDKVAVGGADDLPPVQVREIVIRAVDAANDRPSAEGS